MADNVKVKIAERNGVELDYDEEYALNAENIPYDNSDSGLTATDIKSALDELDSQTATTIMHSVELSRQGNVTTNTWLLSQGTPSNKVGALVKTTGIITQVTCGSENLDTYTVQFYKHNGDSTNLTSLGSVSVTSARSQTFTVSYSVTQGDHIGVKITSGSGKNIKVTF
jgi:hypothetical protein